MGWLYNAAVVILAVIAVGRFGGKRWNARGGLFDPLPALNRDHRGYGKVALVTGANAGLGFEMARGLYGCGYTVLMAARSLEKAREAKQRLQQEEQDAPGKLFPVALNLSSLEDVRKQAATLLKDYPRLDIVIHNAGVWASDDVATVNHYAPFLLTHLLTPAIEAATQPPPESSSSSHSTAPSVPRVCVLSSKMHRFGVDPRTVDPFLSDPSLRQGYQSSALYGTTKLLNILFARRLAQLHPTWHVSSVHPGLIRTSLHRPESDPSAATWFAQVRELAWALIGISPWQGAQSTLHLVTSPDVLHTVPSGSYVVGTLPRVPENELALDDQLAEWVWQKSIQITNITKA